MEVDKIETKRKREIKKKNRIKKRRFQKYSSDDEQYDEHKKCEKAKQDLQNRLKLSKGIVQIRLKTKKKNVETILEILKTLAEIC